jgi:hypothetical protein
LLVKRFFFLLNAAFAMAILDLISQVHLPSSVSKLETAYGCKNTQPHNAVTDEDVIVIGVNAKIKIVTGLNILFK